MNMIEAFAEIVSMRNDVAKILIDNKYQTIGHVEAAELATKITDQIFLRFMQNTKSGDPPLVSSRKRKKADDPFDPIFEEDDP